MSEFEKADNLLEQGRGEEAFVILRKLAEEGRVNAMSALGHTYLYGIAGIAQDYGQAFAWFTRAAAGGCPQAMYHLGMCNANGYGTPLNPELALQWYRKSAERGDEDAMFRVGDCYEKGFGCERDPAEAAVWYRKAAACGQKEAAERLA